MESLVVSLNTAKRLKAVSFPGKGIAMWWNVGVSGTTLKRTASPDFGTTEQYAAPTAQEIAEQLPKTSAVIHASDNAPDMWEGYHVNMSKPAIRVYGPTMVEALAELWLTLQTPTLPKLAQSTEQSDSTVGE